jgi:hypothetical protein
MTNKHTFLKLENEKRSEQFKKSATHEEILEQFNQILLLKKNDTHSEYAHVPSLFIFGLPRSGTTLLYQIIANCLDVGYIDNIAARFWLSPFYGITLSQVLRNYRQSSDFQSNLGQSADIFGPHEFAYFWHHWLCLKDTKDFANYDKPSPNIDWVGLKGSLDQMKGLFKKPLVFKTMFAANFAEDFEKRLDTSFFIYIERNPTDVALSILQARYRYYKNINTWWGTYPPNYYELAKLEVEQQIIGQVLSLREIYRRKIDALSPDRVICFSYQDVCNAPEQVLIDIHKKVVNKFGYNISISCSAPKYFGVSKKRPKDELGKRIFTSLKEKGFE